jgi:hypothetical protein
MAGEQGIDQQQRRDDRVEAKPPDPGRAGNHFWMVTHDRVQGSGVSPMLVAE